MDYTVSLLIFGLLLFLVGLVGRVKAKELEIGTSSSVVRSVLAIVGAVMVAVSFILETEPDSKSTDHKRVTPEPAPIVEVEPVLSGIYTIQQKSTFRFVDAHVNNANDFDVVTRDMQTNTTQRWIINHISDNIYTIQHQINNRYLDAFTKKSEDYSAVTRPAQNDDSQKWIILNRGNNTYTIQQKISNRYLDAHESKEDYSVVTRAEQKNNTQRWLITAVQ